MTLTCPKCGATHMVDTPSGARRTLRFRCTECGHAFNVDPAQFDPPRVTAGLPVSVGPARGDTTRTPEATVLVDVRPDAILSVLAGADTWAVDTPETLLAWILEGRVLPEDIGLEASGRRTVLAARPGLEPFFAAARVLDDVRTGALVPAHRATAPATAVDAAENVAEPMLPAPADEPPYAPLVPPPDLVDDPPTVIMSPEALAALAAQEPSDAEPFAEAPVFTLAPLTASPTEEATVALASPAVEPPAEVTTGIPAPVEADEADPFDWSAPPPPPSRGVPWGRLTGAAALIAGLAVALLRSGETPPDTAAAPQAEPPAVVGSAAPDAPSAPTPTPAPPPMPDVPVALPVAVQPAVQATAPATVRPSEPPTEPPTVPAPVQAPLQLPAAAPAAPATPAAPRPRNAAALVKAGWAAVEGGDLAKARGLFGDAVSAGGGAPALHGRGYTLQQLGDIDGAVADYCAALAANPPGDVRAEAQTFLQRSKRSCTTATP